MGKEMMNFRGDRSSKKGPNGNPRIKNIVSEIKKINWMKLKAGWTLQKKGAVNLKTGK